jgi:tetratricopeptide (TPR) repeat protein
MSEPGRNSPCPCGSGKRYKDCHGALLGPAIPLPRVDDTTRRQLDAALAAQQAGRLADAVALYEAVIASHPGTFDARHMLGVVHYQRGEFARAREFVSSALLLLPSDAAARHNLQLIESALERRMVERDICRDTLPRLARRCVAPVARDDGRRWRSAPLDVIVSTGDARESWGELERLLRWLDVASPTVWLYPGMPQPSPASWALRVIDAAAGVTPQHPLAVFFGADRSPAEWYERAAAAEVALFCDDDSPCVLLDRIPELAREGQAPLRLLFATSGSAQRVGLPGVVVVGPAAPA